MKKFMVVFSLFIMIWLFGFMYKKEDKYPITRGEIVYELLGKINKKIAESQKLSPFGTLVGMPEGVLQILGLDFQIRKYISIEEARLLLINCTDQFIQMVNADREVSSYLEKAPFTIQNLNIQIFVHSRLTETYQEAKAILSKECLYNSRLCNFSELTFREKPPPAR